MTTPLTINPKSTALILIDLQKGILANQLAPHTSAQIIDNAVLLMQKCGALHIPIFPVHVAFSPDNADRLSQPVDAPYAPPPGGLPQNYADFADPIANLPFTLPILKRNWSAFHGTELDLQLRRRNITTILLTGVATNLGVESTARDAYQHNYATILAEDATTSLSAELHQFSIQKILPRLSRIRSTAEILTALS